MNSFTSTFQGTLSANTTSSTMVDIMGLSEKLEAVNDTSTKGATNQSPKEATIFHTGESFRKGYRKPKPAMK